MRLVSVYLTALIMTACSATEDLPVPEPETPPAETLSEATPPAEPDVPGYDRSWYVSDFWPGEYPDGFIIGAENTVLPGRLEMKPALLNDLDCAVEKGANYSPWNRDRIAADNLVFRSAAKITPVEIMDDIEIETGFSQDIQILSLKRGDVILYKSYLAEGYFLGEFEGETYELNEGDLVDVALFQRSPGDDLWVNVACTGGERAWLLYDEVIREPFIMPTEYTSFGEASDVVD
ncbi:MAG: hypothetical protein AAFZ91_08870 [Pseudomonadota bacterium]